VHFVLYLILYILRFCTFFEFAQFAQNWEATILPQLTKPRYIKVSSTALRRNFAALIGRVAYAGETIVLTRHGRRVAGIVPIRSLQQRLSPEVMYPGIPIQEALAKSLERELESLSD
jgi:prevent-host-death family protein